MGGGVMVCFLYNVVRITLKVIIHAYQQRN